MSNSTKKVAMIGMFRGYNYGEYNPGCFMICLKTYEELQKRLEDCVIDIFAVDNDNTKDEIYTEHKDGLDINFFPAKDSVSLLNSYFSTYDALVIGGDVIWGDYYEEKCPLFFIDSESFIATKKPLVLFNCVHRFTPMSDNEKLFANIKKRANYISVRTDFLKNELDAIGVERDVKTIPDPVMDHDLKKIHKKVNEKPLMGISISHEFVDPLISILRHTDLSEFDVCCYPLCFCK
jgi:polysaccharide pyruvyl transferase WcaK-like protein